MAVCAEEAKTDARQLRATRSDAFTSGDAVALQQLRPTLHEAASLCARAVELAVASEAEFAVKSSRAQALETELCEVQMALESERRAAASHRIQLSEVRQAGDFALGSARERIASLEAQLEAAVSSARNLEVELSSCLRNAADVPAPSSARCNALDDTAKRLEAENARLTARAEQMSCVIRKQKQRLTEHEARLRAYGVRVSQQRKKRRLSDTTVGEEVLGAHAMSSHGSERAVSEPSKVQGLSPSSTPRDFAAEGDVKSPPPTAPIFGDGGRKLMPIEMPTAAPISWLDVYSRCPNQAEASGSRDQSRRLPEPADCMLASGSGEHPRDVPPLLRHTSETSVPGPQEAGTGRVVRAQGALAMVAKPRGPLCRCVVRGKDARSALQGYDCEQCRTFYNAAGVGAAAGRRAPKASRHRYAHPPSSTPVGFWDLSFPRDTLEPRQG